MSDNEFVVLTHDAEVDITEGDEVVVRYESARSDEKQTMEGVVKQGSTGNTFLLDTGETFDDGTTKDYRVGYGTITGWNKNGRKYTLTPYGSRRCVEVKSL